MVLLCLHGLEMLSPNMVWITSQIYLNNPNRCVYLFGFFFKVAFNSQGDIVTGSLQVEETSAYCTVNHRAWASNYQLSNMKRPARDSNRQPQRLEARTLTATPPSPPNRCVRPEPKNILTNTNTRFGPNIFLSRHPQRWISPLLSSKRSTQSPRAPSELDQPQHDPDALFYREEAMADLPSQYAEEVETLRHILDLPDPRKTMPRSSPSVLGLDDQKGQQELRPRGPSAMLPLSSHIKDAFDKLSKASWPLIYLREST